MNDVQVVPAPTSKEILSDATGLPPERLPSGDADQRTALISEAIRIGICSLAGPEGSPVHPGSLRGWVRHKLQSLIPDVLTSTRFDYRRVLADGRHGSLEFVGDVITITDGLLLPAPTRAVHLGGDAFAIVSGRPTAQLKTLQPNLRLSAFGRQLAGVTAQDLARHQVRVLDLPTYLALEDLPANAEEFVQQLLARPAGNVQRAPEWMSYAPARPGRFEFVWQPPSVKAHWTTHKGYRLILWREPISEDRSLYWLEAANQMRQVYAHEIKRLCLALDALNGNPRTAWIRAGEGPDTLKLALGFPMFESVYRLIHVVGGERLGFVNDTLEWRIRTEHVDAFQRVLTSAGVTVKRIGSGDKS